MCGCRGGIGRVILRLVWEHRCHVTATDTAVNILRAVCTTHETSARPQWFRLLIALSCITSLACLGS